MDSLDIVGISVQKNQNGQTGLIRLDKSHTLLLTFVDIGNHEILYHPQTGEVRNIGGAKRIKLLDGGWVGRDYVGAFNIMLKALVDMPELLQLAVNES